MQGTEPHSRDRSTSPPSIRDLLVGLFSHLETAETTYCILRNYQGLPERVGNDVDMLVAPGQLASFESSLRKASDASGWRLARRVKRFGFASYWLAHKASRAAIHIDVWTRLTWKGLPLIDTAQVNRHRTRYASFHVADEVCETGILLLKDLVQAGEVRQKYCEQIRRVAASEPDRFRELLGRTLGTSLASRLTKAASEGNWKQIRGDCGRIRRSLLWHGVFPNPLVAAAGILGFLLGHIRSLFAGSNGMSVALIGPDGSGKSAVAEGVAAALSGLFPAVRFFHGRFRIIPDLRSVVNVFRRVAGGKPVPPAPSGTDAVHDVPPHSRLRSLVYVVYYSLDYLLGHITMRATRSRGVLVLFDRYYYDWFILSVLCRTPRWLLAILEFVYPRPDLIVYLCNSPEVIHGRKPELPIEEIAAQGDRCRWVVRTISNGIIVPTDMDLDDVVRAVADAVVDKALSRYAGSSPKRQA